MALKVKGATSDIDFTALYSNQLSWKLWLYTSVKTDVPLGYFTPSSSYRIFRTSNLTLTAFLDPMLNVPHVYVIQFSKVSSPSQCERVVCPFLNWNWSKLENTLRTCWPCFKCSWDTWGGWLPHQRHTLRICCLWATTGWLAQGHHLMRLNNSGRLQAVNHCPAWRNQDNGISQRDLVNHLTPAKSSWIWLMF